MSEAEKILTAHHCTIQIMKEKYDLPEDVFQFAEEAFFKVLEKIEKEVCQNTKNTKN